MDSYSAPSLTMGGYSSFCKTRHSHIEYPQGRGYAGAIYVVGRPSQGNGAALDE